LKGATPLDWIAAVSGVGIGAALTLLFNGNKEKTPRAPKRLRGNTVTIMRLGRVELPTSR
jgi:hypothetical protein